MNSCIEKCDITQKTNNEIAILMKQLRREVLKFYNDTNESLLCHDQKINELCNHLKNKLSAELRLIIDSMIESGEIDELIRRVLLTNDPVNVKDFGAVGDGVHDDTPSIQQAIDHCYKFNKTLIIPYGIYRTYDLILKCNIKGLNNPIILFNKNSHFQNFENDGSIRYKVTEITNVIFESDKSSYYDSDDVYDVNVIRKYGQRMFIGNNINNIHSIVNSEKLSGEGWWNRDYYQWINPSNINPNDIKTSYANIEDKTDTNYISAPYGIVIDKCKFIGFGVGLTIKGTYNSKITNTEFARCKIGVVTDHAGTLPGKLSDSKSKVTTLCIENCLFDDISYFGIYGESLLQTKIYNNIFQPVGISLVLLAGADNYFYNNYSEIVYCGVLLATNDVKNCVIENNFTNKEYSTYNTYVRYGSNNTIGKHTGNPKCYVASQSVNSDFDELLELTKDNYFYTNGNSQARNKSKFAIFTTTGTGSNIDVEIIKSTRSDGSIPNIRTSQTGIEFMGIEEILSIEPLEDYNNVSLITYYNVEPLGDTKVCYVETWDETNKSFTRKDLRVSGTKQTFKVAFNDGYKV